MVLCSAKRLGVDAAAVVAAATAPAALSKQDRRAALSDAASGGLEGELLVVGTHDGDVWFVEAEKQGRMLRQLPSHRNVPIKHILVRTHPLLLQLLHPLQLPHQRQWLLT
jgi:hypothetical protein